MGGPIIPDAVTLWRQPRGRHCSRRAERWSLGIDSGPQLILDLKGDINKVTQGPVVNKV